jgi:hypothetical protein
MCVVFRVRESASQVGVFLADLDRGSAFARFPELADAALEVFRSLVPQAWAFVCPLIGLSASPLLYRVAAYLRHAAYCASPAGTVLYTSPAIAAVA